MPLITTVKKLLAKEHTYSQTPEILTRWQHFQGPCSSLFCKTVSMKVTDAFSSTCFPPPHQPTNSFWQAHFQGKQCSMCWSGFHTCMYRSRNVTQVELTRKENGVMAIFPGSRDPKCGQEEGAGHSKDIEPIIGPRCPGPRVVLLTRVLTGAIQRAQA